MTDSFCPGCGTPRGTSGLAFCTNCGRRFDSISPAPGANASVPPLPPLAPPTPTEPLASVPAESPSAPSTSTSTSASASPRRSRTGLVLGVCALVLAVAAAGFVGWRIFGSTDTATGADSPEQAVRQLVDAVVDQDGVAALKVVAPGERVDLDDVYVSAQRRLEQEGLTDGETITDAVDLRIDDLRLRTERLGDRAARVTVTGGTYRVSWDPDELPDRLEALKDDSTAESESGDLTDLLHDDDYGTGSGHDYAVSTVEVDGRWYVTLIGTYLDAVEPALEEAGYAPPDYGVLDDDLEPIVGRTPEDVIANLVSAVNDQDVDDLLANLPADVVLGLRPFARTAESALRQEGVHVQVSASDLDLATDDLGGGRIKVTVDGGEFSVDVSSDDDPGGYGDASVGGGCVSGQATDRGTGYDEEYGYDDEDDTDSFEECLGDYPELGDLGVRDLHVVMRKVDGGYQLDPMGTVSAYAQQAIADLPSSLIDERIADLDDELSDECHYIDDDGYDRYC